MQCYRRALRLISITIIIGASILAGCGGGGGGNESFNFGPPPVPCGAWPFPPCSQTSSLPALSPATPPESPPQSGEPLDNWHVRASFPPGDLNAVSYGNGTFVAVGQGGVIVTSADGTRWWAQRSGTQKNLFGVGYGGGIFVAVGSEATILTSADGVQWTDRSLSRTDALYGAAYGNGVFVAVGRLVSGRGASFTSSDGVTWAGPYLTTDASTLDAIVYANNTFFVAVGGSGTQLQVSYDGAFWAERHRESGKALNGVTCGAGMVVAVGSAGEILSSPDGADWAHTPLGDSHYVLEDVAYGAGTFVAVGRRSETGGRIFSSADGVNWRARYSGTSDGLRGIAFGNGTFVIVGSSGAVYQSDAVE